MSRIILVIILIQYGAITPDASWRLAFWLVASSILVTTVLSDWQKVRAWRG